MSDDIERQLLDILHPLVDENGHSWTADAVSELARNGVEARAPALERLFPQARRAVGTRALPAGAAVKAYGDRIVLEGWAASDVARALLLVAGARGATARLAAGVFRHGDENERASIVKSLMLLDDRDGVKPLALEAGRANSVVLFGALALDNAYPMACYTPHEFNQLVLKAMFMGQPIGRIVGLERRANPELSRMSEDFYEERKAAGRPAPIDIWLALVPHASARGLALAQDHLAHADAGHRFHAALALRRASLADSAIERALSERARRETDERVLRALRSESA